MTTRRTRSKVAPPNSFVAYRRVSTEEQAESGAGMDAQGFTITKGIEVRGGTIVEWCDDPGVSGKDMNRPALNRALEMVRNREAGAIVVAKLDRLSRSLFDFAHIMKTAQKEGWNLVALDLGIDLSTPGGEFMANMMASAAQWERRIIGERTRDALAEKRKEGVRLGRPRLLPDAVLWRIIDLHRNGKSFREIGAVLMEEETPTAQGGAQWWAATVRKVLLSQDAARMIAGQWVDANAAHLLPTPEGV